VHTNFGLWVMGGGLLVEEKVFFRRICYLSHFDDSDPGDGVLVIVLSGWVALIKPS
jgi:hypothetical protein